MYLLVVVAFPTCKNLLMSGGLDINGFMTTIEHPGNPKLVVADIFSQMPEFFRFVAGRLWDVSPLLVVAWALIENPQGRWRTTTRYIHLVIQWPNESKTICRKLQKKIEATNCCRQLQKNIAESRMWKKLDSVLTFLPPPPLSRRSSRISGRVCLSVQTTQEGVKATSWRISKNHWGRMNECKEKDHNCKGRIIGCKEKDPQLQTKKNWVHPQESRISICCKPAVNFFKKTLVYGSPNVGLWNPRLPIKCASSSRAPPSLGKPYEEEEKKMKKGLVGPPTAALRLFHALRVHATWWSA